MNSKTRSTISSLGTLLLAVAAVALMLNLQTAEATSPAAQQMQIDELPPLGELCRTSVALPEAECLALLGLFSKTDGRNWSDRTHWGLFTDTISPCQWYGVVCENGHVTRLLLDQNGLNGNLPRSLGNLDRLAELRVAGNALQAPLFATLCALTDTVEVAQFDYNRLRPGSRQIARCLDALDPNWRETQTVPPATIRPAEITSTTITLQFGQSDITNDDGYYEVSVMEAGSDLNTKHGQTPDRQATSYRVDGLEAGTGYVIRVRSVTPAHDANPQTLVSESEPFPAVTRSDSDKVALIIYFSADNNLSPYADLILQRLRRGTSLNPNVEATMLVDRLGEHNTEVWTVANGEMTLTNAVMAHWGVDELNTADPAVLAWFLSSARAELAGAKEVVSLIGHGVGLAPTLAWYPETETGEEATPIPGIPALPRGSDFTPTDVTDGAYMSTEELGNALAAATDNGADPFDILFFDQCFQGSLDVLYEVRQAADILIASPNYGWLIAPYHQYVVELAPSKSSEEMAQAIITRYQRSLNNAHPNTIFWLASDWLDRIAEQVDVLADALLAALAGGEEGKIAAAVLGSDFVDTTQCGAQQLILGPPDEMIGIEQFAQNLRVQFGRNDAYGVAAAASNLFAELAAISTISRTGSPYIAPDHFWDYDDSITILAPLRRTMEPSVAWRASLYRDDAPFDAIWTPDPSQSVVVSVTHEFVKDHRWDEFINAWYSSEMAPTVGQWCQYMPPTAVVSTTTESLVLALTGGAEDGVVLDWEGAVESEPTYYAIYVQAPDDAGWNLLTVVDVAQTSTLLERLEAGEYRYVVAALDDTGAQLARSNEADWFVESAQEVLYLPFIVQ